MVSQDCQKLNSFFNNALKENCCDKSNNTDSIKITCDNDSITSLEINGYNGNFDFNNFPILENLNSIKIDNVRIVILPEVFFRLPKLTEFDLSNNNLEDIPDSICNLGKIKELNLSKNPKLFINNCYLPDSLVSLDLSETNIQYAPSNINYLINLESLNMSKSNLKDLSYYIFNLGKLKYFDISDNPELNAKIINFNSKIDQCNFNKTNIVCYQEGTCSSIDQKNEYKICSADEISEIRSLGKFNYTDYSYYDDDVRNRPDGSPQLLLLFIVLIFIPLALFIYFVHKKRESVPRYHTSTNYTSNNYTNGVRNNSTGSLPVYSEYANNSEEVIAVGDNIPLNDLSTNNGDNANQPTTDSNEAEADDQELPPSYNEVIGTNAAQN
eukprot:jgi/Orpsp1_1/1182097/evm.model.c7180000079894.1